jgi:hypothetical protein
VGTLSGGVWGCYPPGSRIWHSPHCSVFERRQNRRLSSSPGAAYSAKGSYAGAGNGFIAGEDHPKGLKCHARAVLNGKSGLITKWRLCVPESEKQLQRLEAELTQARQTIAAQALALARLSALLSPDEDDDPTPQTSYLSQRNG